LFEDKEATPESVVEAERTEYERLHDLPIADPDERERYYREHIERSPSLQRLKQAMDEWCAVWFWPTDEKLLPLVPTPLRFHQASADQAVVVSRLASEIKYFHWELAFPDVFTPQRSGFDALIGNPPWDVMKPNSQEFFSEFDPLYRTYDKQAALRKQKELFATLPSVEEQWGDYCARFKSLGNWARNVAEPFDVSLARGKEERNLKSAWEKHRQGRVGFANVEHPFRLQGSADLNSYKMFCEVFWSLLQPDGRLGVILPTGIYSDFGTKDLRETLLFKGRLDLLYAFQNEKKVFGAADHSLKQVALFASRGGTTTAFHSRFRMGVADSPEAHEIPDDILRNGAASMVFTPEDVRLNSPKTLSLVELKSERDLAIFRKIYAHSIRIGDNIPGWEITCATEFHMTNDSKHFPPLEKWEAKGYRPDVFGRWINSEGDVALPLYEGAMIHQFEWSYQGWLSGLGSGSLWQFLPHHDKVIRPRFLISQDSARQNGNPHFHAKILFRDVARNTHTRTFLAVCLPELPCGHTISTLRVQGNEIGKFLLLESFLDSFCFDYVVRIRNSGLHQSWFVVADCPIPNADPNNPQCIHLSLAAARLTFLHRRFAPEWLRLKHLYHQLAKKEWKHWWAVTEADRLRLRVEIDALCADLYGLAPDDFDWIVRDDPKDPKGF
jgi:hypothetical protein